MKQVYTKFDDTDDIGETRPEPKKRGRKSKKQNEKEIMHEFHKENDTNDENIMKQRSLYENIQYLSVKENHLNQNLLNQKTIVKNIIIECFKVKIRKL